MRFDFVVLGATGMQGRIASRDLLEQGYKVLLCGRDRPRVNFLLKKYSRCQFAFTDLQRVSQTSGVIKKSKAGIVLNCAEGDWNILALQACLRAGVHCLDLGSDISMTKRQLAMYPLLKKKGLLHITGCGSVPGIGNVMLRYAVEKFDRVDTIEVGFAWDSNIKKFVVPFSIQSIIEEFTDPAPELVRGRFILVNPLSTTIDAYDRFIGSQKELLVRHPETYTFYQNYKHLGVKNVKFFAEFPLHSFEKIKTIIELGLGSKKEINFHGIKIKPVEFLAEVLKYLPIPSGYKEKEDLWVKIIGKKGKERRIIKMSCLVNTLPGWEDAGCNIDTGMTISIIGQMIYQKLIPERGCFAPESVVPTRAFFAELSKRHMKVFENGKKVN